MNNSVWLIVGLGAIALASSQDQPKPTPTASVNFNSTTTQNALQNINNTYGDAFTEQLVNGLNDPTLNAGQLMDILANNTVAGGGYTAYDPQLNRSLENAGVNNLVSMQKNSILTAQEFIRQNNKRIANALRMKARGGYSPVYWENVPTLQQQNADIQKVIDGYRYP